MNDEESKLDDDVYSEAVCLVGDMGQCSVSILQRFLCISSDQAIRLIERMELEELVRPLAEDNTRSVIMSQTGPSELDKYDDRWFYNWDKLPDDSPLKSSMGIEEPLPPSQPLDTSTSTFDKLGKFLKLRVNPKEEYEIDLDKYLNDKKAYDEDVKRRKAYAEYKEDKYKLDMVKDIAVYWAVKNNNDIVDVGRISCDLEIDIGTVERSLDLLCKSSLILPYKDVYRVNIASNLYDENIKMAENFMWFQCNWVERAFIHGGVYPINGIEPPPFFNDAFVSYLGNIGLIEGTYNGDPLTIDPTSDGYKRYKSLSHAQKFQIFKLNRPLTQ